MSHQPVVYGSAEAFFAYGVTNISLDAPLDCTICQEPLLRVSSESTDTADDAPHSAVSNQVRVIVDEENLKATGDTLMSDLSAQAELTTATTDDSLEREPAVQIKACKHIFGRACLETWVNASGSASCPLCRRELVDEEGKTMLLLMLPPTRAMRESFATHIGTALGQRSLAKTIRKYLMAPWVRMLMYEAAIATQEEKGYRVQARYIGDETLYDEEYELDDHESSASDSEYDSDMDHEEDEDEEDEEDEEEEDEEEE